MESYQGREKQEALERMKNKIRLGRQSLDHLGPCWLCKGAWILYYKSIESCQRFIGRGPTAILQKLLCLIHIERLRR